MAYIFRRFRNGKKHFYIAWHDALKGKGRDGRCDVSCSKLGAKNGVQRNELLKFYQDKENKIEFEVKNNLHKQTPEDYTIAELIDKYLHGLNERVSLHINSNGNAGISKSHYWWLNDSVRRFQNFLNIRKITYVSELKVDVLRDFRSHIELLREKKSVFTVNKYLTYTKRFLNEFKFSDPPIFENLELLCSVLKNFPVKQHLPFHFETEQLREIITKAREFDEETCKITRESKKLGKSFKVKCQQKTSRFCQ